MRSTYPPRALAITFVLMLAFTSASFCPTLNAAPAKPTKALPDAERNALLDSWGERMKAGLKAEEAKDFSTALKEFNAAAQLATKAGAFMALLGTLEHTYTIYEQLGQDVSARESLDTAAIVVDAGKAVVDDKTRIDVWCSQGHIYVNVGERAKGIAILRKALALADRVLDKESQEYEDVVSLLANELSGASDAKPAEVESLYKRAIASSAKRGGPNAPAVIEMNFAKYYAQTNQYEASRALYRKALKEVEASAGVDNFFFGYMLARLIEADTLANDAKAAEADAQRLLKVRPTDAKARAVRAWSRYHLGDYKGANADFAQALKLKPDLPTTGRIVIGVWLIDARSGAKEKKAAVVAGLKSLSAERDEDPDGLMGIYPAVAAYLGGEIEEKELLQRAGKALKSDYRNPTRAQRRVNAAQYYIAMHRLLTNDPAGAKTALEAFRLKNVGGLDELYDALVELRKLNNTN